MDNAGLPDFCKEDSLPNSSICSDYSIELSSFLSDFSDI